MPESYGGGDKKSLITASVQTRRLRCGLNGVILKPMRPCDRALGWTASNLFCNPACLLLIGIAAGCSPRESGKPAPNLEPAYIKPEHKTGSDQTYQVCRAPSANITVDGWADEPA